MNKRNKMLLLIVVVTFLFIQPIHSSILNSIKATITDKETGEPLPGVKITITIDALKYEVITNEKGYVYKSGFKNGDYKATYEKEGYISLSTGFHLGVSDKRDISVQMEKIKVAPVQPPKKNLLKKGVDQLNANKFTDAIETLTKALEEDPENPLIYYYRGFSYDKSGDADKALADHQKACELKADFLLSLPEAGKILAKKGDIENALTYYKKAYDLGIKDTLALYNYGACLINQGNNDEALKVFEKIISIDANYADAYYQLGIVYLGLENNAKAKEFLQKFLEMDPENSNASVAKEIVKTL